MYTKSSRKTFQFVWISLLFLGISGYAFQDRDRHHQAGMIAELEQLLEHSVQQKPGRPGDLPGMTTCIYFDEGISMQLWDGYSNPTPIPRVLNPLYALGDRMPTKVEPFTEIESDMLFEACSVTKTFTAAAILRYVENGSISLDDPLKKWIPAAKYMPGLNCCNQVGDYCQGESETCPTIRDLLRMTSGIQDFNNGVYQSLLPKIRLPGQGWFQRHIDEQEPNKFWIPAYVLDHLTSYKPHCAPGEKFLYSSTNYVLLGTIANNLANYPNLAGVYQEICNAADLTDTYLGGYEPIARGNRALGWNDGKPGHTRRAFVTAYWAGGGLLSTAENLAKWAYMLQQPGVVLKKETLKLMRDFYEFSPPIETSAGVDGFYIKGYGLGLTWFQVVEEPGLTLEEAQEKGKVTNLYGHSGGSWAFLSFAFYDPDRELSYAMMVNAKSPEKFTAFTRDYARIVSKYNSK